jgi:mannose-1-phosphate guanylyltransferase
MGGRILLIHVWGLSYLKAVILAGGFGKRLKPLTDSIPKPLLEVGGKPILVRQIEWLNLHGINEAILCIGFLKEKVIQHIGNGRRFGAKIGYVVEEEPLGTGGALLNAEPLLSKEDSFMVLNGDILTNLDPQLLKRELNSYVGSIALVPLRSPYGIVDFDRNDRVLNFNEKPTLDSYWINAGVYWLTPSVFNFLEDKSNIETTAFPRMAKEGKLKAVRYKECFWKSIDVHKDIEEAEKELEHQVT